MARNYTAFELQDGYARAVFVSRQEAASILHAQFLLCQLVTHQEDPLAGSYIASHSSNGNLLLWIVTRSIPQTTVGGLLDVGKTLLLCNDGAGDEQQLSLSSVTDLLPPALGGESNAAEHISEASWCIAVQQLQARAGDSSLSTKQQVAGVMLKLWRYSTAHQLLLPVQQMLTRHRSSMAVLRSIITALQDMSSGQQLHAKLKQQLQAKQQQQQQQSWSRMLAEPSDALVQQLHTQLPGVSKKGLLQLLRLLAAAVAGLEAHLTPDVLQQMLHALDHPGSFQPVVQQHGNGKQPQQHQPVQNNSIVDSAQVAQEQQHRQPQVGVSSCITAGGADLPAQEQLQQQQQQEAHGRQLDDAATGPAVRLPPHTEHDLQQPTSEALPVRVQQQRHQQQQKAAAQTSALLASGRQAAYSQQVIKEEEQAAEEEPYSPTRHVAEEAAVAAAAAVAASARAQPAAANSQQQEAQQQQLAGSKRTAVDGEQLQQAHSKRPATLQALAAGGRHPDADGAAAATPRAVAGGPPAAPAAGPADPAAAAAASGAGSSLKLPGEAYALTLYDDLRFSLQQLVSARVVVDTRGGRLVQLSWYLQVNDSLRQQLPSQELALKFLAKFPGVFRLEKRPPATGRAPETFLGLQPDAAQALLGGKRCQQLLTAYKARLHSYLQQQGSSAGGAVDLVLAATPMQAGGLLDPQLQQYRGKLFSSFQAFVEAAMADEFVLVGAAHGKQGLAPRQPAHAEPADPASLYWRTSELPRDSSAAAAASNRTQPPFRVPLLRVPVPPPAANGQLLRQRSDQVPTAAALAAHAVDAELAWLDAAVADVLHPQDEQQQQGAQLRRDGSSVWERLGGAFGRPGQPQEELPLPAGAAAAVESPSFAQTLRLQQELQRPLQRNTSRDLSPSPALASRLQVPQRDKQPPARQQQQVAAAPQLAPETIDLLDLAIVQAFVEQVEWRQRQRAFAEQGRLPEVAAAKQELTQENAEMPLEALIASLLAKKHQLPGVETEGQLLGWLFHLQVVRGVLVPEPPQPTAGAGPAVGAGGRKLMRLALQLMLQRLLAHRQLRGGQQLAQRVEEVLLRCGANAPGRLRLPRMPLQRAGRLLQEKVPALQPYLLVPGFLEGWVKQELRPSFVLTDSLEQQPPSSRRIPIRDYVNLEVTCEAAQAHGLQLRRCHRYRGTATCVYGDNCFNSHAL